MLREVMYVVKDEFDIWGIHLFALRRVMTRLILLSCTLNMKLAINRLA